MILVVADDLTGAAEMAGEAYAHGLSVEIQSGSVQKSDVDVVVIDTESRSLSRGKAAMATERAFRTGLVLKPEWVFKKVDSLLRGHVRAEIEVMMEVAGADRALLLPSNPSKDRIVRNRQYFVGETALEKSTLAADPEYPRLTSDLHDLLEEGKIPLYHLSSSYLIGRPGIWTADIVQQEDLISHARSIETDTLPAGALDFFRALLDCREGQKVRRVQPPEIVSSSKSRTLFLCGSAVAWRAGRARDAEYHDVPVHVLPEVLVKASTREVPMVEWANEIIRSLERHGSALVAIGRIEQVKTVRPERLALSLTESAAQIIESGCVRRVCVEGGATATALMRRMGWSQFRVSHRWADGVISLRPEGSDNTEVVVKVGSYVWPDEVWAAASSRS